MLEDAFDGELTAQDWDNCLGGIHLLAWEGDELVGHASVIQRRLVHGGSALRAGYVEGVGVRADQRRKGVASALMGDAEEIIRRALRLRRARLQRRRAAVLHRPRVAAVARDAADPHPGRHRGHDRRGTRLDPRLRRRAGPRRHAPVRGLPRRRRLVKASPTSSSRTSIPSRCCGSLRTLRRGSPECTIVLHHDDRRTRVDEAALRALNVARVLPPSPVSWGGPTQLDAFLRSLHQRAPRRLRLAHRPLGAGLPDPPTGRDRARAGARAASTASSSASRSSRRRGRARAPTSSRAATSTATARSARRGARCAAPSPPRGRCSRCARCRGARCSASATAAPACRSGAAGTGSRSHGGPWRS